MQYVSVADQGFYEPWIALGQSLQNLRARQSARKQREQTREDTQAKTKFEQDLATKQFGLAKTADERAAAKFTSDLEKDKLDRELIQKQLVPLKKQEAIQRAEQQTQFSDEYLKHGSFRQAPPEVRGAVTQLIRRANPELSEIDAAGVYDRMASLITRPKTEAPEAPEGMQLSEFQAKTPTGQATFTRPAGSTAEPVKTSEGKEIPGVYKLGSEILRSQVTPPTAPHEAAARVAATGEEILNINNELAQVQEAKKLINDPKMNIVGPVAGSWLGKTVDAVQAAVGLDSGEYNARTQLRQLVAQNVLRNAQMMKGTLSDKDIQFLRETVPGEQATEAAWTKWLGNYESKLTGALALKQTQAAAGGLLPTVTPPGGIQQPGAAAQVPTLWTEEDFNAHPGGEFIWGPTGQPGTKTAK